MASLHVALNALFLDPCATGGAEFVFRRLVPALLDAEPSLRLTVFAARDAALGLREHFAGPRCDITALPVSGASRVSRSAAEQVLLPIRVRAKGAQLLHNLATTAPAWSPVPQVTTVLDLNFRHARAHTAARKLGIALLARLAVRASDRIITISHFVADDVAQTYGVSHRRIDVTGSGQGSIPPSSPRLRACYGSASGYPTPLCCFVRRLPGRTRTSRGWSRPSRTWNAPRSWSSPGYQRDSRTKWSVRWQVTASHRWCAG